MRTLLFLSMIILNAGCSWIGQERKDAEKEPPAVTFEFGSKHEKDGLIVAFTRDGDSLWMDEDWLDIMKDKMQSLTDEYAVVLLYAGLENVPNVSMMGLRYPRLYNRYLLCGYWKYENGNEKFCYGGIQKDGDFLKCESVSSDQ